MSWLKVTRRSPVASFLRYATFILTVRDRQATIHFQCKPVLHCDNLMPDTCLYASGKARNMKAELA